MDGGDITVLVVALGRDEDGVAAHRNAGRVGERAAWRPLGAAVLPRRVGNFLASEDIHSDGHMALADLASPQGAALLHTAACVCRPGGEGRGLDALGAAPEHDVDSPGDGVPTVQSSGAAAQDLNALHRRYRQGGQIEGGIRDAAAINEISDPAAQEQHPVKAEAVEALPAHQQVRDRAHARQRDILAVDHGHGAYRIHRQLGDVAGHRCLPLGGGALRRGQKHHRSNRHGGGNPEQCGRPAAVGRHA